jgi:hypothetical protein
LNPAPPSFSNPNAPSLTGTSAGLGGAPAASITGAGAYTPDWAKLIASDPGLLQTQSTLAAGGVADAASRDAAIQAALVQFGKVPDIATLAKQLGMSAVDVQNALGGDIQKLAQENTDAGLSTESRLSQANVDALRQIKNSLNARGLLNSGETAYQLDRQNTGYRQAESDANQKLLSYLQQYQQGFLTAQQQREGTLSTAYSDAANRQLANNPGSSGTTANYAFTDGSGSHIYVGPDGSLYNADGTAYTAPRAAPQAPSAPDTYYQPSTGITQTARPVHGTWAV